MKTFKRLLLSFSAFLVAFFGEIAVDIACGGEVDPYDYYVSYFHNNVQGDEYMPFAFTQMAYLYSEDDVESEAAINSREWSRYLEVKEQDVVKIMYGLDSATSAKLAIFNGRISTLPDSLQKNSFLTGLSKHKKALQYFLFAKQCEPFANVDFDPWDPMPRDSAGMSILAEKAVHLTKDTRDQFLKLRYAYQAERMFHFAGKHEDSKSVYETFIKKHKSASAVKGWALALYAGSTRRLGNPEESAFLFSKVFASNPERRVQAYRNYFYNSTPVNAALKYAQTDQEKANIWAINGFGNPEPDVESLINVYRYDPKSELNGALLVRAVNKLEQALIEESDVARISYNYYFAEDDRYGDSVKAVYRKNLNSIRAFALKLSEERKYPQPELGTLTAAYLSWMENKDSLALTYLSRLKPDKLSQRLQDQYRITELLLKAKNIKKGAAFNEHELLPALRWLDNKRFAENEVHVNQERFYGADPGSNRFSKTTRNFYQQILAPAYLTLGDTASAALAMAKGDQQLEVTGTNSLFKQFSYQTIVFWQRHLGPESMEHLLTYKNGVKGNGMRAFLATGLKQLNDDDFYELYGTTYLRTHQYDKAVAMFAKVSPGYKYYTPENWYAEDANSKLFSTPFIQTINDYPKRYEPAKTAVTKKTFASEMLRLQQLIVSDKKHAANYYYKMANAVYQTGYFGNSWYLISYSWSSYDNSMAPKYNYDADYKIARTAKTWYMKARNLSADPDFKARCTFMLAKCEQKEITSNTGFNLLYYWDKEDVKYQDFLSANYNNPYFKELKSRYSKTPFYQIAVGECSYLRDFIGKSTEVLSSGNKFKFR